MDKRAVKEIINRNGFRLAEMDKVLDVVDEVLVRVRQGQRQRYDDLAADLATVIKRLEPHCGRDTHDLNKARALLNELIKGLQMPNYHTDIPLMGVPSVHSVPYAPLDEQVTDDPINPNHYKTQSGVQAIDIAELFPYSLGNAIKYAWRAGKKGGTANDLKGREHFLKQDLEKCEWYLNRAMANGEIVFLKPFTQATHKAWHKFKKVQGELPNRNTEVLSHILQGNLQTALNLLGSWLSDIDDEQQQK